MQYKFNVTGSERKRLVYAAAEALEVRPKYLGAPSMAYEIGAYTVTKDGTLEFAAGNDPEEVERVLEAILNEGFECETGEDVEPRDVDVDDHGLTVTLPLNGMDEAGVERLTRLVGSKAALIRKALGAARLDICPEWDFGRVRFPWFDRRPDFEELEAYAEFFNALMKMARESTRVTAKEKDVESEKYAFRGFLLRLGFVGAESKAYRKILMKNLSGSAAFPNKVAADAFSARQKAKRACSKEAGR